MTLVESENNDRAVIISEEIDFFEELLAVPDLSPGAAQLIVDRRDVLRDSMLTNERAGPNDGAEQGYDTGSYADGALIGESEEYDEDDDVDSLAEDDDHDYVANRNDKECLVCRQPKEVCTEEP